MGKVELLIKKNLNIPNILSLFRIVLIVPFVMSMLRENYIFSGLILIASGISDLFDGYIARSLNQVTRLGGMIDPIADKLTLVAVMVCIGLKFHEVIPFMTILIIKECAMLLASVVLLRRHKTPPMAKWYGKLGTIIFYVSVATIVSLKAIWNVENKFINVTLMAITAFTMLYAVIQYLKIFVVMMESDK